MEVTAKIDSSTPAGRKIVCELEKHKKLVKVIYPMPDNFEENKTYTQHEFENKVKEKFHESNGVKFDEI